MDVSASITRPSHLLVHASRDKGESIRAREYGFRCKALTERHSRVQASARFAGGVHATLSRRKVLVSFHTAATEDTGEPRPADCVMASPSLAGGCGGEACALSSPAVGGGVRTAANVDVIKRAAEVAGKNG